MQLRGDGGDVVHQQAFGDLQGEPGGFQSGVAQGSDDIVDHARVGELADREVDRDGEWQTTGR